jgi:hypothetical protein
MTQAEQEVINLEKQFWSESNNPDFFERAFADDGLSAIEPMGFIDKNAAMEMSKDASGWEGLEMSDIRTIQITPDCVGVLYHGMAKRRDSGEPYRASLVSVYAKRDGNWQLVITAHQPWQPKGGK